MDLSFERAPFDHPSICVPHGHPEREPGVLVPHEGFPGAPIAADTMVLAPRKRGRVIRFLEAT